MRPAPLRPSRIRAAKTARELAASAAILLAIAGCSSGTEVFDVEDASETAVADWDFTIPEGAGEALDSGNPLEILPARLEATVGETIRIVNEDDRGHLVGPFFVPAQATLNQTFSSPGEFIGECTVHPSGQIRVIITA